MRHPMVDGSFILYTNASSQGLDAVSSQMQEGQERVIACVNTALRNHKNVIVLPTENSLHLFLFVKQFPH